MGFLWQGCEVPSDTLRLSKEQWFLNNYVQMTIKLVCCSSPFSSNEYNKQEWTSAICSCCHCLWAVRCFRVVYFSFKPFKQCAREGKKKESCCFLSALAFPRCFWHEKCCSTIKKKPHFQKYLGSRTPLKSQGSESAQKITSTGV